MAHNSGSTEASLSLTPTEFQQISRLAEERFGLELKPGKEALVAARLGKKLRQRGLNSFSEYYRQALADDAALVELIDSLTTNHTSFLREKAHFEFLAKAAAEDFGSVRKLEVWSAACSSGEEPYSIAMCLAAAQRPGRAGDYHILATDISTRVLELARRGVYPSDRFRDVTEEWRRRFLLRGEGASQGLYKVRPEVARKVEFERLNLIEPLPRRLFHVIFCRNVMMYFHKKTQQDIVQRLSACLELGGYLLIGHSESLTGIEHHLRYIRPATYQRGVATGGVRPNGVKR